MKYTHILGTDQFFNFAVSGYKAISVDTEYTDLDIKKAELLSISIGVSEDHTYIFSAPYDCTLLNKLRRFFETRTVIFTWNGVVDYFMLGKVGAAFPRELMFDGMLAEHLLDERLDHGLGDFAIRSFSDPYKKAFWIKYDSYQEAPLLDTLEYEMRDGCYTYIAGSRYLQDLSHKMDLVKHVHKLNWALFDVETEGIVIDTELLNTTNTEMAGQIESFLPKLREEFKDYVEVWELQEWIKEIQKRVTDKGRAGVVKPVFSFTSDKQVGKLLYDKDLLGLPVTTKTKK